jgi:hypothetical protein
VEGVSWPPFGFFADREPPAVGGLCEEDLALLGVFVASGAVAWPASGAVAWPASGAVAWPASGIFSEIRTFKIILK